MLAVCLRGAAPGLLLLLLTLWTAPGRAAPEFRLVAGEFPPYISTGLPQQGPMTAEVVRLFGAIGLAPRLLPLVPWPRALAMLKAGQADASFGWGHAEQRQADFISSQPFFRSPRKLFARRDHKPQIGFDDLPGKRLCLPLGYTVPPEIEALLRARTLALERPSDVAACLKMVVLGRADYFLLAEPVGLLLIEQAGLGGQLRAADNAVGQAEFHILLPRHRPDSEAIIQQLNRAMTTGTARP